ncbi:MAG: GNAT family N-acetyltransferase [Pseudomonadales bacterium]
MNGSRAESIQIRPFLETDYEAVAALWRDSEGLTLRSSDSAHAVCAYLSRNPGLSFVATLHGCVIAAALVGTDGRRGYLQHLTVDQQHRSLGVGKRLLKRVVSALAAQGIAKTHLFVHADNTRARQFYMREGWQLRDEVVMYSFNASDDDNV